MVTSVFNVDGTGLRARPPMERASDKTILEVTKKRSKKNPDDVNSQRARLKPTMLKTSICRHWCKGHCKFGVLCGFAHGESELQS
ncbi:hypothetical protein DIPPA_25549 [Diplonema papillatum]|nr:hypothetical protein DIPPA_25549 [Diplonema papillatum]|eukprot:gene17708-27253_t